jgi:hypothetical protein
LIKHIEDSFPDKTMKNGSGYKHFKRWKYGITLHYDLEEKVGNSAQRNFYEFYSCQKL